MSQVPPPYNRSFSFTDFSTYNPSLQQPGNKIDQELNNIRVSVNQTIDRLSEIQLDDGRLDSTSLNFNAIFTGLSNQLSLTYAVINSPVFTGSPEAPTPNQYDNSTKIATTEFVKLQDYATQDQLATLQSSLDGYLTLGGGSLSGPIYFSLDDAGNNSEVASWGFGVANENGNTSYIEPAQIRIYDSVNTVGTSLNGEGITFNDGSVQTSAATAGAFLPLAGGTLTGNLIVNSGSGSYAQVDPSEIFTQQTNAGVGQTNAYGYLYNGGIEIGDTAGKWAELTTTHLRFGDGTTQTTAATAGAFLPLAGGIMSGAIRFDDVGTQNIAKGSFDSGRGGYNGISLTCAVDYELNWQAGYLKALNSGGFVVPVNFDSSIVLSDDVFGSGVSKSISANAISDNSYTGYEIGSDNAESSQGSALKIKFGNTEEGYENQAILQQNGLTFKEGISGTIFASYGQYGITFSDSSVQTTAYDPAVLNDYIPFTSTGTNSITRTTKAPNEDDTGIFSVGGYDNPGVSVGAFVKLTNIVGAGEIAFIADEVEGTFLKFSDASKQFTAFPPTGGLVTEYITGIGSLVTFPPLGDRYLTTSNSTLTCDSGNGKTMTVGTGLSYSRQQDITVSYNNANHMHGTVLTYDSVTGVMTFDSNTHSGSGTYSSWEVNVGGVAGAILPVGGTNGQVLAKINSTNFNTEWISLGSMATATATDYLAKADNLSGLASTSTARTNLGLGAVSTDAYATTAQAQAGTSTTTVVSPATLLDAKYFSGGKLLTATTWSVATSGTGAGATANGMNARTSQAPTTAIGYAQNYGAILNNSRGVLYNSGIDWSKRIVFGGRFTRNTTTPDSNSVFRFTLGRFVAQAPSDILSTDKQVGIKISGSGAIVLMCANGSTLSSVTSSFTPSNASAYDVVIVSDGAGNVTLYVNGSSVATSTGGPTSAQGNNYGTISLETQNSSIIINGNMVVIGTDIFFQQNL